MTKSEGLDSAARPSDFVIGIPSSFPRHWSFVICHSPSLQLVSFGNGLD